MNFQDDQADLFEKCHLPQPLFAAAISWSAFSFGQNEVVEKKPWQADYTRAHVHRWRKGGAELCQNFNVAARRAHRKWPGKVHIVHIIQHTN